MRTVQWMALVLAMAGCLSTPSEDRAEPRPDGVEGPTSKIQLTNCTAQAGEFQVDAAGPSSSVPPGFEVVRDETGLQTTMTVTGLFCDQANVLEPSIPVIPSTAFQNGSVLAYRALEDAYVDGNVLLDHYNRSGISIAYSAALITGTEDTVAGQARFGQVVAETRDGKFTIDWTAFIGGEPLPTSTIRTFVVDKNQDPPGLLGYCDESWSARFRSTPGTAVLNSDFPLIVLVVPPGTSAVYHAGAVVMSCVGLAVDPQGTA